MNRYVLSFAQNHEDIIINSFFKENEKGFYVDLGANHPVNDSVTKLFYNRGWSGINIEPNEQLYKLLKLDRPRDINLKIGISSESGTLELRQYLSHGLSTFSKKMIDEYKKHPNQLTDTYKDYKVPVKTLKEVFEETEPKQISFLKVDIEGFEYEALVGNDWKKYEPELICIESNHIIKDWRPLLKANGYTKVFFDGLNDYYLSKRALFRKEIFSYEDSMLLSGTVLQWNAKIDMLNLQTERDLAKARLDEVNREIEIPEVHTITGVKYQVKQTLKAIDKKISDYFIGSTIKLSNPDTLKEGNSAEEIIAAYKEEYDKSRQGNHLLFHNFYELTKANTNKLLKRASRMLR